MKAVPIAAYNLVPGAAFTLSEPSEDYDQIRDRKVEVVTSILYRHSNSERVGVVTRKVDHFVDGDGPAVYDTHSFHYEDKVWLVGLCINPDTWDDNDFGNLTAS